MAALLEVKNLTVRYEPRLHRPLDAVRDVSFTIEEGGFVGLIGESGSGKSTLGDALLRLTTRPGRIAAGEILFDGHDLTAMTEDELRPYRWRDIATVFQSSMNALNPVVRVEDQFRDAIELHSPLRGGAVRERVRELFDMVMIEHRFIRAYPHELSGGMRQRVNLALALANHPRFVLLDEPTTGLDVVVQRSILDAVRTLQRQQGFSVLFISHDMGTVLELSDRILVMYAGKIVEEHTSADLLRRPLHPYSKGLMGSYGDPRAETVRLTYVPGRPPDLALELTGCPFAPRCPEAIGVCVESAPELLPLGDARVACHVAHAASEPGAVQPPRRFAGPEFVKTAEETREARDHEVLLQLENVSRHYRVRSNLRFITTAAVESASFELRRGAVTALVGQSGSGKSTLAKLITGVEGPTSGAITFHSDGGPLDVGSMRARQLRQYRRQVQMVFQDPYSSLNPTKTLRYILSRPLRNYHGLRGDALSRSIEQLLEKVALTPVSRYLNRYPHELSGGQRQRVVIARALAADPKLIVADEPISSLDVSIRAEILELLHGLVADDGVTILYITHDLLSARMIADQIVVLKDGRVVETGDALDVIQHPQDDYTRLLLDAIPNPFETAAATPPARAVTPAPAG
jgi:peptide/nickel transport system ATP-binding protein